MFDQDDYRTWTNEHLRTECDRLRLAALCAHYQKDPEAYHKNLAQMEQVRTVYTQRSLARASGWWTEEVSIAL